MDNLHPLECSVLLALSREADSPSTLDQLTKSTGLDPSQLSMAVEWLLAKSLIAIHAETVAHLASLTPVGELYFEQFSPIERVLSAAREAGQTGKRLTIQDIQAKEGLEPSDVSKAVGSLKKEGAVLIVQGGCVEKPAAQVQRLRRCGPCCSSYGVANGNCTHCSNLCDRAPAACGEARECA